MGKKIDYPSARITIPQMNYAGIDKDNSSKNASTGIQIDGILEKINEFQESSFNTMSAMSTLFWEMYRNDQKEHDWDLQYRHSVFMLSQKFSRAGEMTALVPRPETLVAERRENRRTRRRELARERRRSAVLTLSEKEWNVITKMKINEVIRNETRESTVWFEYRAQKLQSKHEESSL